MNRRAAGTRFESLAADYLVANGYSVLCRNHRSGRNEIDLICLEGDCVVFVEVKGARTTHFGDPIFKVNQRKQESLIAAAQGFLQQSLRQFESCRFDVISVVEDDSGHCRFDHRIGAFTL